MKLFLPLGTPQPLPSCAGVEQRLRAFAPRNRDGVRRHPRFGPLAIPLRRAWLASGRLCRRPSGGRMFEAAVLRLWRTDSSADLAGPVKRRPQSPGTDGIHGVRLRGVNLHSACSSALSGRRGSGDIRFMVRGERPKADHVGFFGKESFGKIFIVKSLPHASRQIQRVTVCASLYTLLREQLSVGDWTVPNLRPRDPLDLFCVGGRTQQLQGLIPCGQMCAFRVAPHRFISRAGVAGACRLDPGRNQRTLQQTVALTNFPQCLERERILGKAF